MMTLFSLACAFGAGAIVGHMWGTAFWPAIKAKIWPGSVPIKVTPEQVAATKPPPVP